jgi:hypothetical protein
MRLWRSLVSVLFTAASFANDHAATLRRAGRDSQTIVLIHDMLKRTQCLARVTKVKVRVHRGRS